MSKHQIFCSAVAGVAIGFLLIYPTSVMLGLVAVTALILYGFTIASEQLTVKRDMTSENRIKEVEQKVELLMIARGMGR